MSLYVECKPDETVALALGVARHDLEHALSRAGVCIQVSRQTGSTGMVDEDPDSAPHPYMRSLAQQSWEHRIRVLFDESRKNRIVVISPRLEEWLVESVRAAGLKLTDFGFESDSGRHLHGEINQRLGSLDRLVQELLAKKSPRILRLQSLIKQS